jgi:DNA-3-methyladenine glycosylase II
MSPGLQQAMADVYARARRHLSRRDPVLKQVAARVGPCTLRPGGDGFQSLARAIVSQMISTKAAVSISARLEALAGPKGLTAAAVARLSEESLRGVGLSGSKARAMMDLAARVQDRRLPLARLSEMTDEEVIAALAAVRGIGRWTAEMFLIFSLGRLDVLPVDDFGLRAGVQEQYALPTLPRPADLRERAEPWRPYRSVATWYFWRSRGFVPQSG